MFPGMGATAKRCQCQVSSLPKTDFFGGLPSPPKSVGNPSSPIEIASTIYCNSKSYMLHETRIICIYIWLKFMVHVAQYFIDEAYGQYKDLLKMVVPQM